MLDAGESAVSVLLQTASHSVADAVGDEQFVADGETSRLEFAYRRSVGERLELGIEIPWLTHQPGGLDSFIDGWHDFFGFPDGARDDRPRDVLEFGYLANGNVGLAYGETTDGLGDIRLTAGWRLQSDPRHALALRLGLKLPTGDEERLLGSGGTDLAVGLAGDLLALGGNDRFDAFYRLNAVYLGEPRYLRNVHDDLVFQGAAGISWHATGWLSLTAQASLRSALYDSSIEMLGDAAMSLTVGGTLKLSDRLDLALAVGEDIKVSSTPDVTFQAAIHYLP